MLFRSILCAVLMTEAPVTISNIPDIHDVNMLIELLTDMHVSVEKKSEGVYTFCAKDIDQDYLETETFLKKCGKLRGSVMMAGPLLTRFGHTYIPKPGGDKIGRRRLDTHILGFQQLGAEADYEKKESYFRLAAKKLNGKPIILDEPSVTGTANIIMAAVLASGTTTIYNAACEPYVQQLCLMLNNMGAKIQGIGSNYLTIEGVKELGGTSHRLLPDMIEVGSFIGLAAMTQSDIIIKGAGIHQLGVIPEKFRQLGIQLSIKGDDIHIPEQDIYEIHRYTEGGVLTIYDHPWPGFTPDLLSIMLVTAIQAKGSVLIHQKMFESRL